jgi:hypothetical protein
MRRFGVHAVLFCALSLTASAANAALVYELNTVYTGGTPSGSAPWLRMTFTDKAGYVELKIENLLSAASEFCTWIEFNLDPALDPSKLSFAFESGQAAKTISTGRSNIGEGGRWFDIELAYSTSGKNGGADRFTMGETSIYQISSTEALSEASFAFLSSSEMDEDLNDVYAAAAHIQGIDGDPDSSKIRIDDSQYPQNGGGSVPAPTSTLLCGIGVAMLTLFARRRA